MSAETPKCAHNITTSTINWFRIGLVCHRVVEMKYTGVRTQERTSKTMHFECWSVAISINCYVFDDNNTNLLIADINIAISVSSSSSFHSLDCLRSSILVSIYHRDYISFCQIMKITCEIVERLFTRKTSISSCWCALASHIVNKHSASPFHPLSRSRSTAESFILKSLSPLKIMSHFEHNNKMRIKTRSDGCKHLPHSKHCYWIAMVIHFYSKLFNLHPHAHDCNEIDVSIGQQPNQRKSKTI